MSNELTENQKDWIIRGKKFLEQFYEKSKTLDFDRQLIKQEMRIWLNSALLKIPFSNLNCDHETYAELCTQPIEKMEWGVIQKSISIILGINPETFGVDPQIRKVYECYHTTDDSRRFCAICDGGGFVGMESKPSQIALHLLTSTFIVTSCKLLEASIKTATENIRESIASDIWNVQMNNGDRFNANGEIDKIYGKQSRQVPVKPPNSIIK